MKCVRDIELSRGRKQTFFFVSSPLFSINFSTSITCEVNASEILTWSWADRVIDAIICAYALSIVLNAPASISLRSNCADIHMVTRLFLRVLSSQTLVGSSPRTKVTVIFAFFSDAFLARAWSFSAYSRSRATRSRYNSRT